MSQHVTGAVIKALREKCHYTQAGLAIHRLSDLYWLEFVRLFNCIT